MRSRLPVPLGSIFCSEGSRFASKLGLCFGPECKMEWRALVWARRVKIEERCGIGRKGGGGIVQGAVSCGAGYGDFLQGLATGSGTADVDEQPRSGSGRETAGTGCVWRNRARGSKLGVFSRHRAFPARTCGG